MLTPRPARKLARLSAGAACAVAVLGTVFACSTSDDTVTFGGGATNDAAAPPSFVTPDSSDAGPQPEPPPRPGACITTECPAPYATCTSGSGALPDYPCDTNTDTDIANCGACGHKCPAGSGAYHFSRACVAGTCQPFCQAGYADCNGSPDDGCESDPKIDAANCGICGNACAPGVACIAGKCGCPPGQTNCDGTCVDTKTDDGNCGACGTQCTDHQPDGGSPPPHMFYGCNAGKCDTLKCVRTSSAFWSDCNGSKIPDGCEVDLDRPNLSNCGSCGNACNPGQQCFSTSDTGMACQCQGPKSLCPGDFQGPLCADLESDPRNCGSCGYICPQVDNADLTCSHGRCGYSCTPGRADCNGRANDGCEVVLANDPRNCGACGASCDVAQGQPCIGGVCATKDCDAGPVK